MATPVVISTWTRAHVNDAPPPMQLCWNEARVAHQTHIQVRSGSATGYMPWPGDEDRFALDATGGAAAATMSAKDLVLRGFPSLTPADVNGLRCNRSILVYRNKKWQSLGHYRERQRRTSFQNDDVRRGSMEGRQRSGGSDSGYGYGNDDDDDDDDDYDDDYDAAVSQDRDWDDDAGASSGRSRSRSRSRSRNPPQVIDLAADDDSAGPSNPRSRFVAAASGSAALAPAPAPAPAPATATATVPASAGGSAASSAMCVVCLGPLSGPGDAANAAANAAGIILGCCNKRTCKGGECTKLLVEQVVKTARATNQATCPHCSDSLPYDPELFKQLTEERDRTSLGNAYARERNCPTCEQKVTIMPGAARYFCSRVSCLAPKFGYCAGCDQPINDDDEVHVAPRDCYAPDPFVLELIAKEGIMPCPNCKIDAVKYDADHCNHITCPRCNIQYCAACGERLFSRTMHMHHTTCKQSRGMYQRDQGMVGEAIMGLANVHGKK